MLNPNYVDFGPLYYEVSRFTHFLAMDQGQIDAVFQTNHPNNIAQLTIQMAERIAMTDQLAALNLLNVAKLSPLGIKKNNHSLFSHHDELSLLNKCEKRILKLSAANHSGKPSKHKKDKISFAQGMSTVNSATNIAYHTANLGNTSLFTSAVTKIAPVAHGVVHVVSGALGFPI